ncbi:MAG: hypothetical protein ACI845_002577 [Gammaproteobacteria bacterium]|jgi:hypothetical protein
MLALARYTLKGPRHASAVVAVLAVVALFLPLAGGGLPIILLLSSVLTLYNGALVGLIILTQGLVTGSRVIATALVGVVIISGLMLHSVSLGFSVGLSVGLAQWLPIVGLSAVLRISRSLGMMLLAAMLLAAVGIVAQSVIWPDLQQHWQDILNETMQVFTQGQNIAVEDIDKQVAQLAQWMVLGLVPSLFLLCTGILLASRSMQARLDDSDAYQKEFRQISLGKSAAIAGLVALGLGYGLQSVWAGSIALLVICGFMYQGIAVVHVKFSAHARARTLLTVFYILLVIFPQVAGLTALVGMIDNWLVFRKNATA